MARPLYQVIADDLRNTVAELPQGHQLQSEQELAQAHGVHRDTLRDALLLLETEGLISRRRGRGGGTFVRRRPEPVVEPVGDHQDGTGAEITTAELSPPAEIAETLGLSEGQPALIRRRVIQIDRQPTKIGEAWYPADLVRDTPIARPEPTGKPIRQIFMDDLGLTLAPYEEYVSARMPSPDEIAELRLSPGVPVLVTSYTVVTDSGMAVMTDRTVLAGDRYVLVIPGIN